MTAPNRKAKTIQTPCKPGSVHTWNWFAAQHPTYSQDFKATVALCEEKNVAVQTIKSIARGAWSAGMQKNRITWYQPLEGDGDIRTAVQWVLSHRHFFLNSVGDVDLLPIVLRAADEMSAAAPEDSVMADMIGR